MEGEDIILVVLIVILVGAIMASGDTHPWKEKEGY